MKGVSTHDSPDDFAKFLKEYRVEKEMNNEELAKKMQISLHTLKDYMYRDRTPPPKRWVALSRIMGRKAAMLNAIVTTIIKNYRRTNEQ